MSTEQAPLGFPALHYVEAQAGRTVTGPFAIKVAHAADILALCRPTKTIRVDNAVPGVYSVGFARTPNATLLYLSWWFRAHISINAGDQLSVGLVIDDGTASIGPVNALIPIAFQGTTHPVTLSLAAIFTNPAGMTLGGEGWLDLDDLATTLTLPDWTLSFVITRPVGTVAVVDRIEGFEVPRGTVSDADAVGALAGPLNPGNAITAGSTTTDGWERIHATLQAAIAAPPEYLSLAWINDIGATIPKTSSATHVALTNLEESAGVSIVFRMRVRPMTVVAPPGTAAGEAARFRVLYYVAGGGTAEVRLHTGSTGSPYATAGLTGAAWAWSAWTTCALPTNVTDQIARLTFDAKTSAGTVYLAAIVVEGVAP
jgi:hypothetical protein